MPIENVNQVKTACAIGVAASIYRDIESYKNTKKGQMRMLLASDAVDRTIPLNTFFTLYQKKPANMPDAEFLLQNIRWLCYQPPEMWPALKVKPRERGEYVRVMNGLDVVHAQDLNAIEATREEAKDALAMLGYISSATGQLDSDTKKSLEMVRDELLRLSK